MSKARKKQDQPACKIVLICYWDYEFDMSMK